MEYRVLLLQNGEVKKVLHSSKTNSTSIKHYKKHIEKNKDVKLPRHYLTSNKVIPVLYEICRVKKFEEKDRERLVRDRLGRLVPPVVLLNKWTVLEYDYYDIEETFYVFGYNPTNDRKNFDFILGLLVKGVSDENLTKNIIVLNNKLIIFNEYQFDIVICKCKADAVRLYNLLLEVSTDNKLRRLLFMGEASEKMIGMLYEMMMEVTGWDYRKVTRLSTNT